MCIHGKFTKGMIVRWTRTYRHLTREKRAQIEVLLQWKLQKVALRAKSGLQGLGRNPEPYTRYFGDSGQRVYEHRRRNSHCPIKLPKAKKFVSFAVKQILTKHPAPDTICGLAREKGCFNLPVLTKREFFWCQSTPSKILSLQFAGGIISDCPTWSCNPDFAYNATFGKL